jgi:hypothetical protein
MRERDVPQEGNSTLGGYRRGVYAVAEDGRVRLVASRGWEVEEIVTRQALQDLERQARDARERALKGLTSPLEVHMYRSRMDLALLSQITGLWRWRIRRHFRPQVFARLSPALRQRYADALGLSLEALGRID